MDETQQAATQAAPEVMASAAPVPPAAPAYQPLPGTMALFKWAWEFYTTHMSLILSIMLPTAVLGFINILFLAPGMSFGLLAIPVALLSFVVNILAYQALVAVATRDTATVSSAYSQGLAMVFSAIWITLLIVLPVMGGFLLLIVPGIILSIYLSFSVFVLYTEGKKGTAALAASWFYVRGYAGPLLWRYFVFLAMIVFLSFMIGIVVGILAAVAKVGGAEQTVSLFAQAVQQVIMAVFMMPLSILFTYAAFLSLKQIKATQQITPEDERSIKKKLTILSVLGAVALVAIFALSAFAAYMAAVALKGVH